MGALERGAKYEGLRLWVSLPDLLDEVPTVAVGQAESLAQARRMLETEPVDVAVVDLGLPNDLEARFLLEHREEGIPNGGVILHEQHARLFFCLFPFSGLLVVLLKGHLEAHPRAPPGPALYLQIPT